MARWFPSVPPEVNTTSSGSAPISAATWARASSTAARAFRPAAWMLDGLAHASASARPIASRTSGSSGAVALWSR